MFSTGQLLRRSKPNALIRLHPVSGVAHSRPPPPRSRGPLRIVAGKPATDGSAQGARPLSTRHQALLQLAQSISLMRPLQLFEFLNACLKRINDKFNAALFSLPQSPDKGMHQQSSKQNAKKYEHCPPLAGIHA